MTEHKKITLTYDEHEYTLEYTRDTIKRMEQRGFDINQLASRPMTLLPELFAGAFLANHKELRRDKIDKIFDEIPDRKGLLGLLSDMYNEPVLALIDSEETSGNAKWEANW